MTSPEPLVRFYDIAGPKPWSPACWRIRYALNYKKIPYVVTKLSYPDIKPTCVKLLPHMIGKEGFRATAPIIEILAQPYSALNDSGPIAELLNERFTEKDGYPALKLIKETCQYEDETEDRDRAIFRWIGYDVWANAILEEDGSKHYFKSTREGWLKKSLSDLIPSNGGEEVIFEDHKVQWLRLKERMATEDGKGEPTYLDFYDASLFRWVEAANAEKGKRLMNLYDDDTFVKLMNKVKPYEA